ncbi:MAG: FG-GAP-like repeat-containing protein [bacterium]|nr:FG-GAP-like repeat-containing protein [bacterium]
MKKVILLVDIVLIGILLSGIAFEQKQYIDKGTCTGVNFAGPFYCDYNRNMNDELIIPGFQTIYFYEIQSDSGFSLINQIDGISGNPYLWTAGTGDFDSDGLKEIILGYPENDTQHLRIYEQSESTSFFDNLVWQNDTLYTTIYNLGVTNKLKGDGVDRILGAGIPWLSKPTKAYGWYYYTCVGDNQYEILNTYAESTSVGTAMDIGDINGNGLTDVVIKSRVNYLYIYESTDIMDTFFVKVDSITESGYASEKLLILPDIDRDGVNEIMKYQIDYIGFWLEPVSYGYLIYEKRGDIYDTIFNRHFEVGTNYNWIYGGDIAYCDIDGDGINEIVICGGRHLEVWEAIGDNQFKRIWEWTDPTYKTIESHLLCYDFNKNGIDEIVFSGYGISSDITRIFECDTTRDPSAPEIVKAEASDGEIVGSGVDYDDYIRIEFSGLTTEPYINKSNIDSMLRLSGGHSYLANGKYLDTCRWEQEGGKSVLYIELTEILSPPTVSVGDTIYPDGVTIRSFEYPSLAISKPVVIGGSFGPMGIEGEWERGFEGNKGIKVEKGYIKWQSEGRGILEVYDIKGSMVIRDEREGKGENKTEMNHLKNGIYFIRVKGKDSEITKKIVKIR